MARVGSVFSAGATRSCTSYTMQGDREHNRKAYEDFFTTWRDANPDIPILRQAKTEYQKLTGTMPASLPR